MPGNNFGDIRHPYTFLNMSKNLCITVVTTGPFGHMVAYLNGVVTYICAKTEYDSLMPCKDQLQKSSFDAQELSKLVMGHWLYVGLDITTNRVINW